jgi:hypothetical protein
MGINLNYFAIVQALGARLGPRIDVPHGPIGAAQLNSTVVSLQHRRRFLWDDEVAVRNESDRYYHAVRAAFLAVRQDQSVEKVIVDPDLNTRFIQACRNDFGVEDSAFRLNLALMNLRKRGQLRGLHSARGSHVVEQWQYAFASEVAARTLYFRNGVSVDTMLCHPDLTAEFDRIASCLAPGFSSFEYRWTALNIRKKGTSARVREVEQVVGWSKPLPFHTEDVLPDDEGLFALHEDDDVVLFVGTTEDIQASISSGTHIADPGIFSESLWTPQSDRLTWRIAEMEDFRSEERHAFVRQLVGRYRPVFNIPRGRDAA